MDAQSPHSCCLGTRSAKSGPRPSGRETPTGLSSILSVATCGLCAVALLLALGGCGAKAVLASRGTPFDLDKIPFVKYIAPKEGWKDKGIRLAQEKRYEEAVEAFKNYVLEAPEDFFGFNAIAVCYKNQENHAEAMQNFERALELADSREEKAKILANIGNLYFSANKHQVALGYYREAAAEHEKNPLYLVHIARTFVAMDEQDRARKVLVQAESMEHFLDKFEREDDMGLGAYLMAHSYVALGDEENVVKYLTRAMKANPRKYIPRLKKELSDQKSLLFTLRDHPKIAQMIQGFSIEDFFAAGLKR